MFSKFTSERSLCLQNNEENTRGNQNIGDFETKEQGTED